ncbi:hypothetical protein CBS147346_10921 [Aspergillus niger]|nr:hypothetical protein CBS147346_10921 [Aspergillus niger]
MMDSAQACYASQEEAKPTSRLGRSRLFSRHDAADVLPNKPTSALLPGVLVQKPIPPITSGRLPWNSRPTGVHRLLITLHETTSSSKG